MFGSPPVVRATVAKDGKMVEITDRATLEHESILENIRRFSLPFDTPFMKGSLVDNVGFLAEKEGREQILNGTYKAKADVSVIVQRFLKQLSAPNWTSMNIKEEFTIEEHIQGWKKKKIIHRMRRGWPPLWTFQSGVFAEDIGIVRPLDSFTSPTVRFFPKSMGKGNRPNDPQES